MFVSLANLYLSIIEITFRVGFFGVYFAFYLIIRIVNILINVTFRNSHTKWRQITVCNALLERIGIDGVAEILICIGVVLTARRGGHTELICKQEVVHQVAPLALVVRTAAVTFVYYDEIEEICRILLVVRLTALIGTHEGLKDGKIEMSCRWHLIMVFMQLVGCDAHHGIFWELFKIVDGLVGKYVTVGNEEDARTLVGSMQVPFGLK